MCGRCWHEQRYEQRTPDAAIDRGCVETSHETLWGHAAVTNSERQGTAPYR